MLHTDCSVLCSLYGLDIAGSSSPLITTIKPETKRKSWFLLVYLIKTLQRFPGRYKGTETDLGGGGGGGFFLKGGGAKENKKEKKGRKKN